MGTLGPALFALQQQMPQQQQQPQASPVQQAPMQPQGDPTQAAMQYMMQQAQGLPSTSELTQNLGGVSSDLKSLQDQYANIQRPDMQMHFDPVTGPWSLLKDVGKGLLLGTGPGRAALGAYESGKERNYLNHRQNLADQIAAVKSRQEIPEKELGAKASLAEGMGNMSYKQGMLGVRQQQADTAQQRVNDLKDFRQSMLTLNTSKLSEQERHNKQDEILKGMGVTVQRDRNQVILSLGNQRVAVDESKFDAAQANKEQGLFDQIGQALGLKEFTGTGGRTTPLQSQAPALGGSSKPSKPKSQTKGGTTRFMDGGRAYNIPSDQVEEFKRDHPNAR